MQKAPNEAEFFTKPQAILMELLQGENIAIHECVSQKSRDRYKGCVR